VCLRVLDHTAKGFRVLMEKRLSQRGPIHLGQIKRKQCDETHRANIISVAGELCGRVRATGVLRALNVYTGTGTGTFFTGTRYR